MEEINTSVEALFYLQQTLEVGKNKTNDFGNFKYRSADDIIEALKPLLKETQCVLLPHEEIIHIGDRYYYKHSVTLHHIPSSGEITATGFAREPEHKTKSDDMQVSGMASSYAKKYALCDLFAIDNGTPDIDSQNNNYIIGACTSCGMQYQFESQEQMSQCQCECGGRQFTVVP